nr:type II secretion system F family protein [Desulfobulbaceae bacterium]
MPKFSYQAINPQGERVTGTLDASNAEAVQTILSNQGSIPLTVKSFKESSVSSTSLETFFAKKVKTPEIILFTKQLRTMLRSGIPILSIFSILADQSENISLKKALGTMEKEVHEGATMASVFRKHPAIFSKLYCGLINAGEISGTMPEILDRVTYILEHEYKVKRDIKAALAYPKLVILTLFGAFFFLLTFVIPKFVTVFSKAGLDLPRYHPALRRQNRLTKTLFLMIGKPKPKILNPTCLQGRNLSR